MSILNSKRFDTLTLDRRFLCTIEIRKCNCILSVYFYTVKHILDTSSICIQVLFATESLLSMYVGGGATA
jgi:hypothetical protein